MKMSAIQTMEGANMTVLTLQVAIFVNVMMDMNYILMERLVQVINALLYPQILCS